MIIVGLFGYIGAGKDTVADYLVAKYDFKKIVMSDIVKQELAKSGREINRKEMQNFSKEYKAKYGAGIWAKKCVEHARQNGFDKVVISGMRDSQEIPEFKLADKFILVFVDAPQELRFKRIMKRGSEKDVKNEEQLLEQEKREIELFDLYRNYANYYDYKIENKSTISALKKEADKFVSKYGLNK